MPTGTAHVHPTEIKMGPSSILILGERSSLLPQLLGWLPTCRELIEVVWFLLYVALQNLPEAFPFSRCLSPSHAPNAPGHTPLDILRERHPGPAAPSCDLVPRNREWLSLFTGIRVSPEQEVHGKSCFLMSFPIVLIMPHHGSRSEERTAFQAGGRGVG